MEMVEIRQGDIVSIKMRPQRYLVTKVWTTAPYMDVLLEDGSHALLWRGFVEGVIGHEDLGIIFSKLKSSSNESSK